MSTLPHFARAWLAQRDSGAARLAELERQDLAELSAEAALPLIDALLAATPRRSRAHSGFVEQQRWFARARR
jgi:hypothetical protein